MAKEVDFVRLAQPPFFAPQGEADYAGMPSVWLRLFGCNLNCGGFNQKTPKDPSTYVLPQFELNVDRLEDLPVFEYGCDSGYAWNPKFKKLSTKYLIKDVAKEIYRLNNKHWIHPVTGQETQLCFTGGEPMLQQDRMIDILGALAEESFGFRNGQHIPQMTIETNGTKEIQHEFIYLAGMFAKKIHFAISPKLWSVSGEKDAVKPDIIESYLNDLLEDGLHNTSCIKFVHNGSVDAWEELEQYESVLKKWTKTYRTHLYIMPCGGTLETQSSSKIAEIADEAIRRGYRVAARTHVYLYGNAFDR